MIKMTKPKIALIGLSGESLFFHVDHFHKSGETVTSTSLYNEPGGKGYNQAVAVSRLGGDAYYLSAVGNDASANSCETFLLKEGVHPYFVRKMNQKTAIATILTNNEGENQVTVFHGANDDLDSLDLLLFEDVIKSCDCLLIQFEVPIQVVEKAIQIAKANHRFIIINPAPAVPNTLTLLQEADIITPNFNEAKTIFDLESDLSIEDFKKIINKKIKEYQISQAIITLGKDGALIVDHNQQIEIPAIKVNTIDTTGAGDVFNAALAVSLAKGIDLLNAAKFANKAAALSVTKRYVMPSLPYLSEIK